MDKLRKFFAWTNVLLGIAGALSALIIPILYFKESGSGGSNIGYGVLILLAMIAAGIVVAPLFLGGIGYLLGKRWGVFFIQATNVSSLGLLGLTLSFGQDQLPLLELWPVTAGILLYLVVSLVVFAPPLVMAFRRSPLKREA